MKPTTRGSIEANGTELHYVEAGEGRPLLLLHGGLMSTGEVWAGHPGAYATYLDAFAARFRVIAPDTRGHGHSANPGGGPIGYPQLADDLIALSSALGLDGPLLCGFSDGGMIATVAAIRAPGAFRAVVNDAGFDLLDPRSHSFGMARQLFGDGPEATRADPEATERSLSAYGMADFVRRLKADHDGQGPGGWKATLAAIFGRLTAPEDITLADLRRITAPTLVLTGDRDMACPAEQAVATYRALGAAELAIVPGLDHGLSEAAIAVSIDFLHRHSG